MHFLLQVILKLLVHFMWIEEEVVFPNDLCLRVEHVSLKVLFEHFLKSLLELR